MRCVPRSVLAIILFSCFLAPLVAAPVEGEESVAFNTKSLKYHCKTCTWAVRCTVNSSSLTDSIQ